MDSGYRERLEAEAAERAILEEKHVAAWSVTASMQKGPHTSTSLQEAAATCAHVGKLEVTSRCNTGGRWPKRRPCLG